MAVIRCGKCGGEGHNARSCGRDAAAAKPAAAKAAKAKKPAPDADDPRSVGEQLEARAEKLRRELTPVDRVIADLKSLEVPL